MQRSIVCDMSQIFSGEWPRTQRPPFYDKHPAPAGVPVLSVSGLIRGITLSGGAACPSKSCDGHVIAIDWETGQLTFPCSKGWEQRDGHIRLVAGGEITGRVINRVDPIPKSEWPTRILTEQIQWPQLDE
jgi:hypothetical protein